MSRRFSRRHGVWMNKHLADNVPAEHEKEVVVSEPPKREKHPAITPTKPNWYRVMRAFKTDGDLTFECIGEFEKLYDAFTMAAREEGRSRVTDCHSHVLMDNWRNVETRNT